MAHRTAGPGLWDWAELMRLSLREAQRILGKGPDAQDAAQEAILRAYRARSRCRSPEAPDSWIRAIARREALRLIGARRQREGSDALASAPTPDNEHDQILDRVHVQAALARLNEADRALVLRRYVLDQSSAEIAEDLNIAPASVRVRLHRAMKYAKSAWD